MTTGMGTNVRPENTGRAGRLAALAGFLILAAAGHAQAANFTIGNCLLTDVTANGRNADACANFLGNNNNYRVGNGPRGFQNYINPAFGTTGSWTVLGRSNDSGNTDGLANITGNNVQSGIWSLTNSVDANAPFVVTLKASNFFAAYYFDEGINSVANGTFDVRGVTTGNPGQFAALSHMSVYLGEPRLASPAPFQTPEPSTAVVLLIGLGGIAALARRE